MYTELNIYLLHKISIIPGIPTPRHKLTECLCLRGKLPANHVQLSTHTKHPKHPNRSYTQQLATRSTNVR
jgi:hypothetical protein